MTRTLIVLAAVAVGGGAIAQGGRPQAAASRSARPAHETDPDKFRLVLEDERVRVFRYHDEPGARTRLHHHDAHVVYALSPFRRRITLSDGTVHEHELKKGDALSLAAQDHVEENIGPTNTDALVVELKPARSR